MDAYNSGFKNLDRFYNRIKSMTGEQKQKNTSTQSVPFVSFDVVLTDYVKAHEKDSSGSAGCINVPSKSKSFIIRPNWYDANTYMIVKACGYYRICQSIIYEIEFQNDFIDYPCIAHPEIGTHIHYHKGDLICVDCAWLNRMLCVGVVE